MKQFLSVTLSLIALVTAIYVLCITAPGKQPTNFDYIGFIVMMLTALVTIILGWQIYNVLTTAERIKKLSSLYEDISSTTRDTEQKIEQSKFYIKALTGYVEIGLFHELDKVKNNESIGTLCNDYIRLLESFHNFLKARDTYYPIMCLVAADSFLTSLSSRITEDNCRLPEDFAAKCDDTYRQIAKDILVLPSEDIDFYHALRARRKSLATPHHNPPVTNPYGVRLRKNRVSTP